MNPDPEMTLLVYLRRKCKCHSVLVIVNIIPAFNISKQEEKIVCNLKPDTICSSYIYGSLA